MKMEFEIKEKETPMTTLPLRTIAIKVEGDFDLVNRFYQKIINDNILI